MRGSGAFLIDGHWVRHCAFVLSLVLSEKVSRLFLVQLQGMQTTRWQLNEGCRFHALLEGLDVAPDHRSLTHAGCHLSKALALEQPVCSGDSAVGNQPFFVEPFVRDA